MESAEQTKSDYPETPTQEQYEAAKAVCDRFASGGCTSEENEVAKATIAAYEAICAPETTEEPGEPDALAE